MLVDPSEARAGLAGGSTGGVARRNAARVGASITLLWIPLGAGAHVVRASGAAYEWLIARRELRRTQALFHAALEVRADGRRWTVELAPEVGSQAPPEAIAMRGPVGVPCAGRSKLFSYELRIWEDGRIDDRADVAATVRFACSDAQAVALIADARALPPLTWGRDEAVTGDMWNSNSAISWLLEQAGIDARALRPPGDGRAPGWEAGLVVAQRPR